VSGHSNVVHWATRRSTHNDGRPENDDDIGIADHALAHILYEDNNKDDRPTEG
jgi:hypothetical protein